MNRLALIIPCYNEEDRLPCEAFISYASEHPDVSFFFVDDGSTDGTRSLLEQMQMKLPGRITIVSLSENQGKAQAVRMGILEALCSPGDFTCTGYWDADLSTSLEELSGFLRILNERPEVVMVTGCRIKRLGARIKRHEFRHYLGRFFASAASLVLGLPVYDTQCGAKIMRANIAAEIFSEPFISRWIFDVEIFFRVLNMLGSRWCEDSVYEQPLSSWNEVANSKIRIRDIMQVPLELARIKKAYSKHTR